MYQYWTLAVVSGLDYRLTCCLTYMTWIEDHKIILPLLLLFFLNQFSLTPSLLLPIQPNTTILPYCCIYNVWCTYMYMYMNIYYSTQLTVVCIRLADDPTYLTCIHQQHLTMRLATQALYSLLPDSSVYVESALRWCHKYYFHRAKNVWICEMQCEKQLSIALLCLPKKHEILLLWERIVVQQQSHFNPGANTYICSILFPCGSSLWHHVQLIYRL